MENQHRKISGYRELSQEEIDLMNEIKAFGPQLESLVDRITKHIIQQHAAAKAVVPLNSEQGCNKTEELNRIIAADPGHWVGEGKDSLQKGLMFLTRAIAQPTFF